MTKGPKQSTFHDPLITASPDLNRAVDRIHEILASHQIPLRVARITFADAAGHPAGELEPCKINGKIVLVPKGTCPG
jgi:hypothetical protein